MSGAQLACIISDTQDPVLYVIFIRQNSSAKIESYD